MLRLQEIATVVRDRSFSSVTEKFAAAVVDGSGKDHQLLQSLRSGTSYDHCPWFQLQKMTIDDDKRDHFYLESLQRERLLSQSMEQTFHTCSCYGEDSSCLLWISSSRFSSFAVDPQTEASLEPSSFPQHAYDTGSVSQYAKRPFPLLQTDCGPTQYFNVKQHPLSDDQLRWSLMDHYSFLASHLLHAF